MAHQPGQAPAPSPQDDNSSTYAWNVTKQSARRLGLVEYPRRRIDLVQGQVLSADYSVPSAIQNAVQGKYRIGPENGYGLEEFTHMRCMAYYHAASGKPTKFPCRYCRDL
jgi:chitin synthase